MLVFQRFRHINLVKAGRVLGISRRQHMADRCEDHPGGRNDGTFLTTAFHDAFIWGFVIRRFVGFHGCMGSLHQCRFEADAGTCDPNKFLLKRTKQSEQIPDPFGILGIILISFVKTILRVRSWRAAYLCLKGETYTD